MSSILLHDIHYPFVVKSYGLSSREYWQTMGGRAEKDWVSNWQERGLLQVRAPSVCFYALRDDQGVVLIDCGFVGGIGALREALERAAWEPQSIRGILLTHGHLDHILNVAILAREYGAWVLAPRRDALHYAGTARYSGAGRLVGALESVGRRFFRYEAFEPDRYFREGELLEVWQGLEVVSLPGHTAGHVGFYCRREKLLFSGDLFASFGGLSHLPPFFFNQDSQENRNSLQEALTLDLEFVLPSHCDQRSPSSHLVRMRGLSKEQEHSCP